MKNTEHRSKLSEQTANIVISRNAIEDQPLDKQHQRRSRLQESVPRVSEHQMIYSTMPLRLSDEKKIAFNDAAAYNEHDQENDADSQRAYHFNAVSPRDDHMRRASNRVLVNQTPPSLSLIENSMKEQHNPEIVVASLQQSITDLPYLEGKNGLMQANTYNERQLENLASSRGFTSQKKKKKMSESPSKKPRITLQSRYLNIKEHKGIVVAAPGDASYPSYRSNKKNNELKVPDSPKNRVTQSSLEQPQPLVSLALKKRKSAHQTSQKKSKRSAQIQIDAQQQLNGESQKQSEVAELLETQQFSQSFLEKLMQPQEELKHPTRNSTKGSNIINQVTAEFVMREDTKLRSRATKVDQQTTSGSNYNEKKSTSVSKMTQQLVVEKLPRRSQPPTKNSRKVIAYERAQNFKLPKAQVIIENAMEFKELERNLVMIDQGRQQPLDERLQDSLELSNEEMSPCKLKVNLPLVLPPGSQQNLTLPILQHVNITNAMNESQDQVDDILSQSIKKSQAKRQLFTEAKPPAAISQGSQKLNFTSATKNGLTNKYHGHADDFQSPLIQHHKRLAAIASEKNRLGGNRNFKVEMLSQSEQASINNNKSKVSYQRHLDSAGIVSESNGTLPPVPQPALCSPEIGHIGVTRLPRTNILEQSNQKRLAQLQPLNTKPLVVMASSPGSAITRLTNKTHKLGVVKQLSLNKDLSAELPPARLSLLNLGSGTVADASSHHGAQQQKVQSLASTAESKQYVASTISVSGSSNVPNSERSKNKRRGPKFQLQNPGSDEQVDPAKQTSKFGEINLHQTIGNGLGVNLREDIEEPQRVSLLDQRYNARLERIDKDRFSPQHLVASHNEQQHVQVVLPTLKKVNNTSCGNINKVELSSRQEPSALMIVKKTTLIKCEDQASNQQTAILNSLNQLKRRKNQGGQRLKPLSSGSEINLVCGQQQAGNLDSTKQSSYTNSSPIKRGKKDSQHQQQAISSFAAQNNSLIESDARPEQFNFTFNPKDEEEEQKLSSNPYITRDSSPNDAQKLKIAKHQSTEQRQSLPHLEKPMDLIQIQKQGSQATIGLQSNSSDQRRYLDKSLDALSLSSSSKNRGMIVCLVDKKINRDDQVPSKRLKQVMKKMQNNSSRQQSPSQGGTTATLQRPSQLSQFLSSSKQESYRQNVVVAGDFQDCDPFNESISSQVARSLDPLPVTIQDAQLMQEAMENLELNPPAEFFEEAPLVQMATKHQRVSAMKFSVPTSYPPLMAPPDQQRNQLPSRQGSDMDSWRYKNSPSVQDITKMQIQAAQQASNIQVQPFRIGLSLGSRHGNIIMVPSGQTPGGVLDDDGETFAQLEHNLVMTSAIAKNKDEFSTLQMGPLSAGSSLRNQANQGHMQEFTPQFPANSQALTSGKISKQVQALSSQNKQQSKKIMILQESERLVPPEMFETEDKQQSQPTVSLNRALQQPGQTLQQQSPFFMTSKKQIRNTATIAKTNMSIGTVESQTKQQQRKLFEDVTFSQKFNQ